MSRAWREYMFIWMVVNVALIVQSGYVESCIEEERLALLDLKSYIISHVNDPNAYINRLDWPGGDCCSWEMVQCNPATRRITELDLSGVALVTPDSVPHLWVLNLTLFKPFGELMSLDLSLNGITGLVENDGSRGISNLKNLQHLTLEGNNFHVPIFPGFCELNNLLELDLSSSNLSGGVPSCLNNLSSLQHLDLSGNNLEGEFLLSTLANISQLQFLDLSRNHLEVETEEASWQPAFQLQYLGLGGCSVNLKLGGEIPKFLTHQWDLSYIDLSDNGLVGTLPNWLLDNNSMLDTLLLRNNSFTGCFQLPRYINLSFEALDISSNDVQGVLPENIGLVFPELKFLNVSGNHMEGHIPDSLRNMQRLHALDLSYNNFSGELPKRLLSDCVSLVLLRLSNNHLQGDIIPEDMNLPELGFLELNNNHFGGTIKDSLLNSPRLLHLDMANNRVTGQLPTCIDSLPTLNTLSISNNNLQGQIPTEICRLRDLKFLDLSQNNFTGPVLSWSDFSSLSYMHLQKNSLTGPIPNALLNGSKLITLDLTDNQLSGSIPSWINRLLKLQVLLLGGNNLDGRIPPELCELQDINILDLSHNHLSGELLACFANMSFGKRATALYDDSQAWNIAYTLSKPYYADVMFLVVPEEVVVLLKNQYLTYRSGILQLMSGLDLSGNKLSGIIPQELGDLSHVHSLNLSHNCLSESIPSSLSNLKQIESLDLSYNNLSGRIPDQLVELNFLAVFNVSYNNLIGRVPDAEQFADFNDFNYLGNPGLCGSTLSKSCNPVPPSAPPPSTGTAKEDGEATFDMEDFFWSFGMSAVVAFMATIAVLGINPQWREAWFNFVKRRLLWWLH